MCCAAAPVPRRRAMCAPATATSFRPRRAGSSRACDWRAICAECVQKHSFQRLLYKRWRLKKRLTMYMWQMPLTPPGGGSETLCSAGCPVPRRRHWSRSLQPQGGEGGRLRRFYSLSLWGCVCTHLFYSISGNIDKALRLFLPLPLAGEGGGEGRQSGRCTQPPPHPHPLPQGGEGVKTAPNKRCVLSKDVYIHKPSGRG